MSDKATAVSDRLVEAWRAAGHDVLRDCALSGAMGFATVLDAIAITAANAILRSDPRSEADVKALADIVRDSIVEEVIAAMPLPERQPGETR